jgi:hypothetical protein
MEEQNLKYIWLHSFSEKSFHLGHWKPKGKGDTAWHSEHALYVYFWLKLRGGTAYSYTQKYDFSPRQR